MSNKLNQEVIIPESAVIFWGRSFLTMCLSLAIFSGTVTIVKMEIARYSGGTHYGHADVIEMSRENTSWIPAHRDCMAFRESDDIAFCMRIAQSERDKLENVLHR